MPFSGHKISSQHIHPLHWTHHLQARMDIHEMPVFLVEDVWQSVQGPSSLAELAVEQKAASTDLVEHHYILCCLLHAILVFNMKAIKPLSLFDTKVPRYISWFISLTEKSVITTSGRKQRSNERNRLLNKFKIHLESIKYFAKYVIVIGKSPKKFWTKLGNNCRQIKKM